MVQLTVTPLFHAEFGHDRGTGVDTGTAKLKNC